MPILVVVGIIGDVYLVSIAHHDTVSITDLQSSLGTSELLLSSV